jgi:hypothetical protein
MLYVVFSSRADRLAGNARGFATVRQFRSRVLSVTENEVKKKVVQF